jgi:hypothetical protein
MSWVRVEYKLTGDAPLVVKCAQMADTMNRFAKELKSITSKRMKTDADHEEMARIEHAGSLYMAPGVGPIIPADNITAAIREGAKKTKEGKIAQSAVFGADPGYFKLEYDGPRTPEELFADTTPRSTPYAEGFRFTVPVVRSNSRIISTRPIFHDWSLDVALMYEDSIINFAQLDRWIKKAGTMSGLCEWRPRFGRFTATCLTEGLATPSAAANDSEEAPKKRGRSLVRA